MKKNQRLRFSQKNLKLKITIQLSILDFIRIIKINVINFIKETRDETD